MDLRNHGRSAAIKGLGPPHNISTAAKDLADLVKARGWPWPDVVVGHSMGGKVALDFAESCSRGVYGDSADLPKQVGGAITIINFRTVYSKKDSKIFLLCVTQNDVITNFLWKTGIS